MAQLHTQTFYVNIFMFIVMHVTLTFVSVALAFSLLSQIPMHSLHICSSQHQCYVCSWLRAGLSPGNQAIS